MARDEQRYWAPPDRLQPGKKRWGWVDEIVQDGERWLQQQPFWNDLAKAEDLIRGKEMLKADENRSDLTSNRLKRILREMVAAISDVRYPENAWSSDNKAYADQSTMFAKVSKGVWYESRAPLAIRRMAQWMVAGGNGVLWPTWRRRNLVDPGSTMLCFDDYGPRDVIPFMMPQDNNIQGSYATTVIRMMSIPEAHARFPLFQDKLRAVTKKRMQSSAVNARLQFMESFRSQNNASPACDQLCEIRYTMVRDLSINQTDMPIPMGEPGASWSYVVPPMKADTPDMFSTNGQRKMHQANVDDARLYPNMRLIITGSGVQEPLYDGPYWYWHGMMPPRFFADDWAWESSGFSLIRDVLDLERTRQFTERAVDQKIKAQMDPAMIYDQTVINAGTAEEFDPWEMRKRLGVDGDVDKAMKTAIPAELLKVGAEPFEWLKYLCSEQDEQLGANQMNALAKAKMSVSGGSGDIDDLLKVAGPIVRDISVSMESPAADVMEMVKYDVIQFMDTARVMTYVGPDGVSPETFDFDPSSVVPSHLPGEDNTGSSKFSRMERAKAFARNLRINIPPGSLHGISQTQQKLLLLQGSRAGLPISPRRVMREIYGIENFEREVSEWTDWKQHELELAAKLKQEGASLLPQAPPGGATAAGSQKGSGGRPPSGQKPPAARTKASAQGPRATVSESG